jgi:parallel beta-helix repeat protein
VSPRPAAPPAARLTVRVVRLLLAAALAVPALTALAPGVQAAPERDRTRLRPDPLDIVRFPAKLAGSARRHIVVRTDAVQLWSGGTQLESVPFDGTDATLPRVASAVAASTRPDWLEQTAPGIFLARVSLVQAPGTTLTVAAPEVRELRLRQDPELYISAVAAVGRYTGVSVTSWDEQAGRPEPDPQALRPFVLYSEGSTLDIVRSRFSYLGSDRSRGAYGVTWEGSAGKPSTGKAVASTFANNFFGAYTFLAKDIAFSGNVFRDNTLYGLDPHDYTTGLRVIGNRAFRNGTHGIVFSVGVTGAIIRDNHSYENGANGIVMDERSNDNLITNNRVERNKGDGIVMLGSSHVTVRANDVSGNRVGIRVNLRSARNRIEANRVDGNERGIELYGGAREITLNGNAVTRSKLEGIAFEAPGSTSTGDRIEGAPIGVEVRSLAKLSGISVTGAEQGVVVTGRGIATVERSEIDATRSAVHVQPGGVARVDSSKLSAAAAFDGAAPRANTGNSVASPAVALPWLAMAGAAFLVVAVVLQVVHRTRNRPSGLPKEGPKGVWNTS